MKTMLLGDRTGLRVSALALGTGRLGTAPDRDLDPAEARRVLEAFATAGGTLIDLSSAYQGGRAEAIVGDFLAGAGRDVFVLSSKYGRTSERQPAAARVGNHRGAMLAEVEGSLRRLKTDRIDLYFAHFDDGLTPIEEIMRGFDDLARAGKIVHAGLSNFPAWRTASACTLADVRATAQIAALQLQYNLLERSIEREHLPLARAWGLGVLGWSPLAGGLLKAAPRHADTSDSVLHCIDAIANEIGCNAATVSLAWVIAKDILPIIGPRHADHLDASLAALAIRLTSDQIARLDAVSAKPLGYPYDILTETRDRAGITGSRRGEVR